jgi:hypothetical protein
VKGPFAVTVIGIVVVIAAIIVNDAYYSPDEEPALPPSAGPSVVSPPDDVPNTPAPTERGNVKADRGPVFDLVRVAPDGHAVIAGQAEPSSRVVVLDGDRPLGEVLADAQGNWVFLPTAPLEPGEHLLGLTARVQDRAAVLSHDLMVVVIPEPGENIAGPVTRQREQPLAMKVPRSGSGPATVLQTPGRPVSAPTLAIHTVDQDADGQLTVSGSAPPEAVISVYAGDQRVGEASADPSGRWLLRLGPVPPGDLVVRADQVDSRGRIVARAAVPFSGVLSLQSGADGRAGASEAAGFLEVEAGQNLWRIARNVYGTGHAYTIIYEANRSKIKNPDLIYPGQVFSLPAGEKPD